MRGVRSKVRTIIQIVDHTGTKIKVTETLLSFCDKIWDYFVGTVHTAHVSRPFVLRLFFFI
jgi:hypothetical protein